jgi:putative phosphoribosyl transferase
VRYDDLRSAGRELARALADHAGRADAVVLALVRGGVPAAAECAAALALPVDVLLLRGLLQNAAGGPARAVRVAGRLVLEDEVAAVAPDTPPGRYVADGLEAFARRELLCRGERPPLDLAGRTVLLVDNGMRTGGTMRAAVRAVRRLGAARAVAAVPISSLAARDLLEVEADALVCLATADPFPHVGFFYRRFDVPADSDVQRILVGSS